MLSYLLSIDKKYNISIKTNWNNKSINIMGNNSDHNISINYDFSFKKYGIFINEFELLYFKSHLTIWNHFINSSEKWCLIREKDLKITVDEKRLYNLISELPDSCDIFFPFDKTNENNIHQYLEIYTSFLGYYWGSHIYFLNKKGARKLSNIKVIRQPVDEEILMMSLNNELNLFVKDTNCFLYNEKYSRSYIERKKAITNTLLNHPAWNKRNILLIRKLIGNLTYHAKKLDIDLVLHGGSLLGAIRHHQIMPWDDDLDLGIYHSDVTLYLESIKRENVVKVIPWPCTHNNSNTIYYKFWLDEGETINGYPYKFPFVDLWLFYDENENFIIYKEGYIYPKKAYIPFNSLEFEGSELKIPNDPLEILDLQYPDPSWRKYIVTYPYSHRLERLSFKHLKLAINVDEKGYSNI